MNIRKSISLKVITILFLTDILETFAQYCFKKSVGLSSPGAVHSLSDLAVFLAPLTFSVYLWAALLTVFLIFVIWCTALSKVDLSVAVPVASLSYIGVPLVSKLFLGENISVLRWFGIFLILMGILLVSKSAGYREQTE